MKKKDKILHVRPFEVKGCEGGNRNSYVYIRRELVTHENAKSIIASIYEIPPKKSAYPYHYHILNEEIFYILSGSGVLKTENGVRTIIAGDFLFFPANINGTHKLTNISNTETLKYLDISTQNSIDVTVYPDSKKIGVWCKDVDKVFKSDASVDYFKDE